jgi:hypothetical protein
MRVNMTLREVARRPAAGLVAAALLTAGLAASAGCGEKQPAHSPPRVEDFRPLLDLGSRVVLSSDQDLLVDEQGYPGHFFITVDPLTGDRVENWTYFPLRESYTFLNGRSLRKEVVEDKSDEYPPSALRPEDFGPGLSLQEAGAMLGEPFRSSDSEGDRGELVIILFYESAVLDYTDGRFTGVETMIHPFAGRSGGAQSP